MHQEWQRILQQKILRTPTTLHKILFHIEEELHQIQVAMLVKHGSTAEMHHHPIVM